MSSTSVCTNESSRECVEVWKCRLNCPINLAITDMVKYGNPSRAGNSNTRLQLFVLKREDGFINLITRVRCQIWCLICTGFVNANAGPTGKNKIRVSKIDILIFFMEPSCSKEHLNNIID